MYSKQIIFAAALSITITGMAFSQCVAPDEDNSSSENGKFIADTSMQPGDTSMQDGDTTQNGDTTQQDGDTTMQPGDTTQQDGDTLSLNSDTTMKDTTQNGDTTRQDGDTTMQDGDTAQQDGDTSMQQDTSKQNGDTTMQEGKDTAQRDGSDGSGIIPSFDPKTIDSISGKVASLDTLTSMNGEKQVQLTLETTDGETTTVFLAPESFLKDLKFDVKTGDSISVVGSKTTDPKGNTVIVASKVIKDDLTYLLRDDKGSPFWPEKNQ